ncbi:MAG TPA: sigma-54-dependent Fis family transcriptional regulator [Firmicutes bacterium]|nr:sigma-54-dependent Fis family transcriptional regulator [Bacillota bacterium]
MMKHILIIEDLKDTIDLIKNVLEDDYELLFAKTSKEAFHILQNHSIDLVITDLKLPDSSGLDILKIIRNLDPNISVVIVTGYGSITSAVEAMKNGAFDYLTKPLDIDELRIVIERAFEQRKLRDDLKDLKNQLSQRYGLENVIARSSKMLKVFEKVNQVSQTNATVLISGESGTGKELLAHAIHFNSQRKENDFLAINCGALPESLLESELFGYEKGAFTGATSMKPGKFELANKGTIFLDEIGELTLFTQVKLLRVLEQKEFMRLGGNRVISVDVRVVAATNKNLDEEVSAGRFREDLFYRLKVFEIDIPPLRERPEDIPLIAHHYLKLFSEQYKKNIEGFSNEAMHVLRNYSWPGNVRELKNLIESIVIVSDKALIEKEMISLDSPATPVRAVGSGSEDGLLSGMNLNMTLEEVEEEFIRKVYELNDRNKSKTAQALGIGRSTLIRKLKQFKIE